MFDPRPGCGIISTVTQTISGRFFILNADVFQQNMLGLKRPILVDNRPVVCVTTSAAKMGRFAFQGGIVSKHSVYLISSTSGHYKIGYTSNVNRRVKELRKTAGPFEYNLEFYWHLGSKRKARSLEAYLHKLFRDKRVNGEWFVLYPTDLIGLGQLAELKSEFFEGV